MQSKQLISSVTLAAALSLAACSSNDDQPPASTSQFNPNATPAVDDGKGGGDTTAIAGLWDGTTTQGEVSDVVYWNLTDTGILTRYDYQQDGAPTATNENCYSVGNPISVFPEDDNSYSIFNVETTTVVSDDTLTITFMAADQNDLDNDGDTSEIPTLSWPLLTTPTIEDLNICTEIETAQTEETPTQSTGENAQPDEGLTVTDPSAGGEASNGEDLPVVDIGIEPGIGGGIPFDNTGGARPLMTRAECSMAGGSIIGDIGDGAIHRPEYRCESGEPPIARITYLEGEPIAIEGEVCCLTAK